MHLNPLDKRIVSKAKVKKENHHLNRRSAGRENRVRHYAHVILLSSLLADEVLRTSRERTRQVTLESCNDVTGPVVHLEIMKCRYEVLTGILPDMRMHGSMQS